VGIASSTEEAAAWRSHCPTGLPRDERCWGDSWRYHSGGLARRGVAASGLARALSGWDCPYLRFICLPRFLGIIVLLALWVASWFNVYTLVAPYALLVGGGIGVLLIELVLLYLVWIDIRLVKDASPSLQAISLQ
jgi:hypothetical protein